MAWATKSRPWTPRSFHATFEPGAPETKSPVGRSVPSLVPSSMVPNAELAHDVNLAAATSRRRKLAITATAITVSGMAIGRRQVARS